MDEMTKALEAEDARQAKLHELLETIREQIRLEVLPEHRPEGLFENIQNAVYAMRGRTPLMNDVVITSRLAASPSSTQKVRPELPLQYEDGPDYCTVRDALGRDFALTMQPELMKAMEAALSTNPGEQE